MNPGTESPVETRRRPPVSLWRLAQKELRETLRDRRTIVTLVLMPLLVYPILSLVFRTFLFSSLGKGDGSTNLIRYRIALQSDLPESALKELLQTLDQLAMTEWSDQRPWLEDAAKAETDEEASGRLTQRLSRGPVEAPLALHEILLQTAPADREKMIASGEIDLIVEVKGNPTSGRQTSFQLTYSDDLPRSRRAASFFREHLELFNRMDLQSRLAARQLPSRPVFGIGQKLVPVTSPPGVVSFTSLIPLVLVLMTITGAVYPAIDLTAGERERGTLETLIATPVPRLRILVGKLAAVLTVAVLTATLNVVGMMTTIWAFQLDKLLMGGASLTPGIVLRIFGLLVLFATFFSALLLVVTSFARSFKEAQAYLIPIIMLSFAPGLIAMTPGLSLAGPLAVCPMINILLLARDILEGDAQLVPAAIAVFSTMVYAGAAIGLAASIFGADSILYGSQGSWREMFLRPAASVATASPATSMLVLALLLPANFISIALMSRLAGTVTQQLLLLILFTTLSFLVFPGLVAWHQRVRWPSGFGLRWPGAWAIGAGILVGLVAWPGLFSLIALPHDIYDWFRSTDAAEQARQRILQFSQEQVRELIKVPLPLFVAALVIVPALCEEWFFRGMLLRSLAKASRPLWGIAASAVAFGAFHTLSGSVVAFDRLIPTTMMGLMLGWIATRTGSIWPGILLHMCHNASATLLARWATEGKLPGWMPDPNQPLPGSWTVASVLLTGGLLVAIGWMTRPNPALNPVTAAEGSGNQAGRR